MMIVPKMGVGSFRLSGQLVMDCVKNALDVGYKAIDTAQIYANEAEIGQAIAESGVAHQDLFLTTKIWVDHYTPDTHSQLKTKFAKTRQRPCQFNTAALACATIRCTRCRGYVVTPSSTQCEHLMATYRRKIWC